MSNLHFPCWVQNHFAASFYRKKSKCQSIYMPFLMKTFIIFMKAFIFYIVYIICLSGYGISIFINLFIYNLSTSIKKSCI